MNPTDPQGDLLQPRAGGPSANLAELEMRYEQLQTIFIIAMIALVIGGLSSCLFMAKQWRIVRAQVRDQRPAVQKMTYEYQKTSEALIRNFTAELQKFAAQNRDFQPILERYREPLRPYFLPSAPNPPSAFPTATPPAQR
jgi:hypothetical protein